jgi:hypothetical protein
VELEEDENIELAWSREDEWRMEIYSCGTGQS